MRKIVIENIKRKPVELNKINIAECKGIGHPDTLMDTLCDSASNTLSKNYLKYFGSVLHHNLDKGLLIAGKSKPQFGGGRIIKPMEIYIAGRATTKVGSKSINVKEIIKKDAKKNLSKFRHLGDSYKLFVKVKEGALNLREIFKRKIPVANDTSFGVAHAPFSLTEKIAYRVSHFLNSKLSKKIKAIGPDIKVMSAKINNTHEITLAIAFIDKFIASMQEYIETKEKVKDAIKHFVKIPCKININTLDNIKGNESTVYLTVTGLSGEQGDDGQPGRGNRISGLISPDRPMSLEATAGKNINHPGKLYQILSYIMAQKISRISNVRECYVKLLVQIGQPLDEPLVSVRLNCDEFRSTNKKAIRIIENLLSNLRNIQRDIIYGKFDLI